MERVVVVGSGPAGLTAALYLARANLGPLVVEGLQPGGQLTTTSDVENFPGFPEAISGADLMERMKSQASRFGARFVGDEVAGAAFGQRPLRLRLSSGEEIQAQAVIVATGSSARYLGLESERKLIGRGVSACATCDGALYRNLPVAVVGGGDSAMQESLFLARLASRVTLIHRRDGFRASRIMADRARANPKIEMALDTVVDEVLDVARNEVTGLRLRNVKTGQRRDLAVSALFVAVGHTPNTSAFAGQISVDGDGYVATTGAKTNVPGVFAAGDAQDRVYRQAVTAAGSGCVAALEAERYLSALGA